LGFRGRRRGINSIISTGSQERIEQPLDQNQGPTPMGAGVFFLANYRQISTFEKPWLPIIRGF
jgi:hypothetical protein